MPNYPLESRMAYLEGAYDQVGRRLASIDLRFDSLEREIAGLGEGLRQEIRLLDSKFERRFFWTIGIVLSTWLTTMTTIFTLFSKH